MSLAPGGGGYSPALQEVSAVHPGRGDPDEDLVVGGDRGRDIGDGEFTVIAGNGSA